jgi:hypothetical protein
MQRAIRCWIFICNIQRQLMFITYIQIEHRRCKATSTTTSFNLHLLVMGQILKTMFYYRIWQKPTEATRFVEGVTKLIAIGLASILVNGPKTIYSPGFNMSDHTFDNHYLHPCHYYFYRSLVTYVHLFDTKDFYSYQL